MNGNGNGGGRAWDANGDMSCSNDPGECYLFRKVLVPKAGVNRPYLPPQVRDASIAINQVLDALAPYVPSDREIVIVHTLKGPLIALTRRLHTARLPDDLFESQQAALVQGMAPAERTPTKSVKRLRTKRRQGRH